MGLINTLKPAEPGTPFKKGDVLELRAHASKAGEGLSYTSRTVMAAEDGVVGGWDVYDAEPDERRHDPDFCFYGFSVVTINRRHYNGGAWKG